MQFVTIVLVQTLYCECVWSSGSLKWFLDVVQRFAVDWNVCLSVSVVCLNDATM